MEFSPMHIFLVLLIVLVLFGGRKLPELMRGLGTGIREFKEGMRDQPSQTPTSPPPSTNAPNPPAAAPTPAEPKK
jgi:sec-independent protein translocase protein TatA